MTEHDGPRPVERPPIRAIVFDAVGTLIEASPSVTDAYLAAAEAQGVRLDSERVRARFRQAFGSEEIHESRGPLGSDEPLEQRRWRRIVTSVLPEVDDPERAFDHLWQHFAQPGRWRVPEDAAAAVAAVIHARLPIRVASNFDARLRAVLAGLPALAGLAESALISSEVGYRKPSEAFYRAIATSLDRPASETLWIGDDVENDAIGPRAAGFQVALVDRPGRLDRSSLPTGLWVVRDLRTLVEAIGIGPTRP
jgi:putative hydrolase of the HAD superfamily